MAKKEYKALDYEMLLSWAMKEHTEIRSEKKENSVLMLLPDISGEKLRGKIWVQIANGGLLIVHFEAAISRDAEEDIRVYRLLNRLNALRGITLYTDQDTFSAKICARQEIYMDHLTMVAAKRAAMRIMVAVTDVICALKTLETELEEYFGKEAMERAQAERDKEAGEWEDESGFRQEDMENWIDEDEIIFEEDEDELPF